jgi:hypothetical protein
VTGHRTLAMVQLYTQGADQERLATGALLRMAMGKKQNDENGTKRKQKRLKRKGKTCVQSSS